MVRDITIVSLSRGILGESFVRHELELGLKRLQDYGVRVRFAPHALSGLDYVSRHPEDRARDLLEAFQSSTDMILCAVGGDDSYRLLPYLFGHDELKNAVSDKIFLGFSDTTMNHFMLHKVGLNTFYGQAFLPDVCELDREMLPYTRHYLEQLLKTGTISEITPSPVWYENRTDFSESALGTGLPSHENAGFISLQGAKKFTGPILGGCIETIYDMFDNTRYEDSVRMCNTYGLFPELNDWRGKILLLESSEEQSPPALYRRMVQALKVTGIFGVLSGVLMGKPADEKYYDEYKRILLEEISDPALPVAANLSVGHALPRCIVPLGVPAEVDTENQRIRFLK